MLPDHRHHPDQVELQQLVQRQQVQQKVPEKGQGELEPQEGEGLEQVDGQPLQVPKINQC
jgi:hypothetical protein